MSTPSECLPACPPSTPVQVPGPTGGSGVNPFTITTSAISLNIATGTVISISVLNCQWVAVGEVLFISDQTNIGHFLVTSAPAFPYTTLQAAYYPQTTDTVGGVGVSIASGATVTPGAYNGADGYTFLSAPVTIPTLASPNVTFGVYSNRGIGKGMILLLTDGTNSGHFLVVSVSGAQTVNAIFQANYNDSPSGNTIAAAALVAPSGRDGLSAYTLTTANFVLPAAQANVTVSVASSAMFAIGQPVFASDGTNLGNFQVVALPSDTSIQLKWLDSAGDSVSGTTILAGAKLVPMGNPAAATAAISSDPGGYIVTGIVTSAPIGPSAGYAIAAGTLQNIGDSVEFEAWFKILVIGGNKTIVINWAGSPIFTYGPASPAANTILKITGRVVFARTGPNLQFCFTSSTFGTVTTTAEVNVNGDPTLANAIQFLLTQTNAADSTELLYFVSKLLPE